MARRSSSVVPTVFQSSQLLLPFFNRAQAALPCTISLVISRFLQADGLTSLAGTAQLEMANAVELIYALPPKQGSVG